MQYSILLAVVVLLPHVDERTLQVEVLYRSARKKQAYMYPVFRVYIFSCIHSVCLF